MYSKIAVLFFGLVCMSTLFGCGDDGGTDVEVTRPTVTETSPQNGATGVGMVPLITVSFSEEMDASSLGAIGITGISTHHVNYDTSGNKATVYVSEPLAAEIEYEVTVPASVKDAEGHSMGTAYSFSFTTGALSCENASDYLEPNDATNQTSHVAIPCTLPVLSSCGASERRDYFSFTLEEASKVTFRAQRVGVGSPVPWSTTFSRGVYQIFANGDSLRADEEVSDYFSFLPGTYTLRAGKQNEDEDIVFYSLTIETSAPCPDDAYEDNDFAFEAAPIGLGEYTDLMSCHMDLDYYSVDLTAGETLTVTAENLGAGVLEGGVYIYDPDNTRVARDYGTHNPLSTLWTAAEDGTYILLVSWPMGEVEYSMTVEVE